MSEDYSQRIAFIVNPVTGEELKAGSRDVSKIHLVLTNPKWGQCQSKNSKLKHECQSRNEFNQLLSEILKNWRKQDQLIFYFSGHGDVRGSKYCLKLGLSDSDWFPFDSLMNDLDINQVQRAILIIDACHSGAALEGTKNSDNIFSPIKKNDIPQGIAIIASSRKTQISRELTDGSSSVFTQLFCQAIETNLNEIGTDDGYIYVEDIVNYIENKLNTDKNYLEFNQRPIFNIDKANKGIWISKTEKKQLDTQPNNHLQNQSNPSIKTPEELRILYENTLPNKHPCIEASVDDLDFEILKQYANKIEPDLDLTNDLDKALLKLKLYSPIQHGDKNILHKSAVLCFYRRPELIYNQARSIFVVQKSKVSEFIREDIEGYLSYQIKALTEKVNIYFREIPKISYIAEDGQRREVDDIDINVARELISNAITHRDYQSTGTVKVTITPEALEVQSPGKFPDELSWEDFINSEIQSKPVDAAISYYLSKLLVFEGIGNGFKLFKQYIQDNGSDSIVCKELPGTIISIRLLRRSQNLRTQNLETLIDVEERAFKTGAIGKIWLRLKEAINWQLAGTDDKYLKCQGSSCSDYETIGYNQPFGTFMPLLKDVFVPLELSDLFIKESTGYGLPELPEDSKNRADAERRETTAEPLIIWDLLSQTRKVDAFRRLAILAWGGFGKTTLLRHVTYSYLTKQYKRYKAPKLLPVLLYLRQWQELLANSPPDLPTLIEKHHIPYLPEGKVLKLPQAWAENHLRNGKMLVMFDGFDEVKEEQRESLSEWLNAQIRNYQKSTFIITSRPRAFNEHKGNIKPKATLFVKEFNSEQQRRFISQWYLAQEINIRAGRNDSNVRDRAEKQTANLLQQLQDREELGALAKNPLLLNMIVNLHRSYQGQPLPQRRAELYQDICTLQLKDRPRARGIDMPLPLAESQQLLQGVALDMMEKVQEPRIAAEDLTQLIDKHLRRLDTQDPVTSDELLDKIRDVSELIVKREEEYEFAHLSFQEFLAAKQIKETKQEQLLLDNWQEQWWRGTILLYAALVNPTSLIRSLIALNNEEATTLALRCLEETPRKIDPKIEAELTLFVK